MRVFVQRARDGVFSDGGHVFRARFVSTGNMVLTPGGDLIGHVHTAGVIHGEGFRGRMNETIKINTASGDDVFVYRGTCRIVQ